MLLDPFYMLFACFSLLFYICDRKMTKKIEKAWKSAKRSLRPASGMQSTRSLVKKHNTYAKLYAIKSFSKVEGFSLVQKQVLRNSSTKVYQARK